MTVNRRSQVQATDVRRDGFWRDPFLWLLLLATFAIRVGYNLALHPDGHPPSTFIIDEREYFGAAHMLAEGRGFSFFDTALWVRPPLYVAQLGLLLRLFGSSYLPSLLLQSLLSALTLLPLAWLAWRVSGRAAARWTALFVAVYLPLTLFAGLLLSETLFVFLFALALVALVRASESLASGSMREAVGWSALAGFLLGLGTLTRGNALAFIPLAGLWLAFFSRRIPIYRRLLASGIVVLVSVVSLVPWTVRNYSAYGRFVPVDTTGGYNLWLGSVGVRDEERLQADLRTIANPADRQSFAYSQAFSNILADPGAFIAKGVKESLDLWRPLFSADERQAKGFALGRVPAWHLLSLLLFDDLLYFVVLALGLLGLALSPPHTLKWLTGLWALLWVVMSFVFFAVTRFRLPVMAALLPWAGIGVTLLPASLSRLRNTSVGTRLALAAGILAAAWLVLVPAIGSMIDENSVLRLGLLRWGQQEPYRQAESALLSGKPADAIPLYKSANPGVADTRYGLASAYLQSGKPQDALATLTESEPQDRFEPDLIRGEAAREEGDLKSARSFFNSRVVSVNSYDALDWAWDHFRPPSVSALDIGSGLDTGYVRGFYGPETGSDGKLFRWSGENAQVRGLGGSGPLQVVWSGWRPSALPRASLTVQPQKQPQVRLPNDTGWQSGTIESGGPGTEADLTLAVNAFVGSGDDQRLLGIRISSVKASK